MKNKFCILLLVFSAIPFKVSADAFPKSSQGTGGPVLSAELIGMYEIGLKKHGGLSFWGGYATVLGPIGLEIYGGPEAAIEIRHYYTTKKDKIRALSFYTGVAYNIIGEQYGAVTPGVKMTWQKQLSKSCWSEPYISLSYPFYFEGDHVVLPYITFGYRFVMGGMKKKG
jgi:hypothetical protein